MKMQKADRKEQMENKSQQPADCFYTLYCAPRLLFFFLLCLIIASIHHCKCEIGAIYFNQESDIALKAAHMSHSQMLGKFEYGLPAKF